jgi:FkbM family methyltransferase
VKLSQRILNVVNDNILNNFGFDLQRYRYDAVPTDDQICRQSIDLLENIATIIDTETPTILDVGSFRGDSIRRFRYIWPEATITGFESDPGALKILHNHWDSVSNVEIVDAAVLDMNSTTKLHQFESNERTSVFESLVNAEQSEVFQGTFQVSTISLSQYCSTHSIEYIDLLNVASRGLELQAIQSAIGMFEEGVIRLVVVELVFDPIYKCGARPNSIFSLLDSLGYACQGIFNQAGRSGHLERADGLWQKVD